MADVAKDFEELLALFNRHDVDYCVVGAYAVAFHAIPRYTKDLDILVRPQLDNGRKIVAALKAFGFSSLKLSAQDFAKPGATIQLGYEPVRIDLLTQIDGCPFKTIWNGKVSGLFGKVSVNFIGVDQLIKNKKASGRHQDLADVETLRKIKKKKL